MVGYGMFVRRETWFRTAVISSNSSVVSNRLTDVTGETF
jgi:hypothetical protein